jgi:hypothetical protein
MKEFTVEYGDCRHKFIAETVSVKPDGYLKFMNEKEEIVRCFPPMRWDYFKAEDIV